MFRKITLALGTSIVFSLPIVAKESQHLFFSYYTIADRVRKDNPDLAAARYSLQEASGRLLQAGRLSNPNLSVQTSSNPRSRELSLTVGFSQKFPLTNRLRLEKEIGKNDVLMAQAEIADLERQLVAQARQAVIEYLSLCEQRRLRKDQIKLIEELGTSLRKLATKGEVSALDVGLVKLEALQLTTELRQFDAQEKALHGIIKPLLGMSLNAPVLIGGDLEQMTTEALPSDLNRRGDIRAAKHSISRAGKQVELEIAQRYDDIEIGVFATAERVEDEPVGLENEGIIGIGVTIPIPWWNKNEGNIAEAKARVKRKQFELIALEKGVMHKAKAAREEMIEWATLIREIDNSLFPVAAEQLALSEKAYSEGQTDIQTVLRSREQKLKLEASRISAVEAFHKARASYESQLGF